MIIIGSGCKRGEFALYYKINNNVVPIIESGRQREEFSLQNSTD